MRALPDALGGLAGRALGGAASQALARARANAEQAAGSAVESSGDSGTVGQAVEGSVTSAKGGVRIGGDVSGDAQLGDIVVIADPHMRDLLSTRSMTDYQFGMYYGRVGDHTAGEFAHATAHWALSLQSPVPAVTASFGAVSSYDSPLIQSLKTARPYGLYSDGPSQQYMLGDGSVFTGTPAALAQFKQQRTAQANMVYIDRVTGSTFGGIALGVSNALGRSPATQLKDYELGVGLDGLTMTFGGVRGAAIPGNNSQTSLSVEANLRLRYMPEWTAEQRAAADLKTGVLDFSNTTVSQAVRGGFSASSRYAREYGPVVKGNDIDHLRDLQLGGSNTLSNLWPLDASVNRSLGAQIQNQIQGLPPGTRVNRVTIGN